MVIGFYGYIGKILVDTLTKILVMKIIQSSVKEPSALLDSNNEISVNTDILVIGFYGYIGEILVDTLTKILVMKIIQNS